MKTKIAILIALVILIFTTISNAKTTDNGAVTLTQASHISKIEASGNVEVYLVNGYYDAVKVYHNYYSQNAFVQNEDGVLRIASYATDKLVVFVTVSDLEAITANDNATVRSYGDAFSAKMLDITLNDDAVAQLKLDAVAANLSVNDDARVELAGTIGNYHLNYATSATVDSDSLRTEASRINKIEQPKTIRIAPMALRISASL